MLRDGLLTIEYFGSCVDFYQNWIREDRVAEPTNAPGRALNASGLPSKAFRVCAYRYSRGDALPDMRDSILQMVEMLKLKRSTLASVQLEDEVRLMYERLDLGTLYESLTLLAFMVSLRLPVYDIQHALELIGHPGEDALLDQVARALGDATRSIATQSKFPQVYDALMDVIAAPAEQRPGKLNAYVEGWYKRMKPIYWHDSHKGAEGSYFGYWCFEAALIAMLFGVDDGGLADHPHYPADLVRHYRSSN